MTNNNNTSDIEALRLFDKLASFVCAPENNFTVYHKGRTNEKFVDEVEHVCADDDSVEELRIWSRMHNEFITISTAKINYNFVFTGLTISGNDSKQEETRNSLIIDKTCIPPRQIPSTAVGYNKLTNIHININCIDDNRKRTVCLRVIGPHTIDSLKTYFNVQ